MGTPCYVVDTKGYSMSVSANYILKISPLKSRDLPSRIVCDKYMYTTQLGDDEIRITSIGELCGWQTWPSPDVDLEFRKEAERQFPQLSTYIDKAITLCGHRPLVSDGMLLLGPMGSGEVIARLINGQSLHEIERPLVLTLKCSHNVFADVCKDASC
jgi:glycine/D-amino acid oxidase-like deaminating enzyme